MEVEGDAVPLRREAQGVEMWISSSIVDARIQCPGFGNDSRLGALRYFQRTPSKQSCWLDLDSHCKVVFYPRRHGGHELGRADVSRFDHQADHP